KNVLRRIVAEPDTRLSQLKVMNSAECHQQLFEWNDTRCLYSSKECLHVLFEQQVDRTSDRIAVNCEDKSISFGELNARADQLARYLATCGIELEARVGIHLRRSLEAMTGIIGVLKAGAAYVPLDVQLPPERMTVMLRDAGVRVVLTEAEFVGALPSGVRTV